MKLTIVIDEEKVADYLTENTSAVVHGDSNDIMVDGYICDVIEAITESMEFTVDRDDVEVIADVIPIRGVIGEAE